jgi:mono/diheme cytochrome c family protein
MFIRLLTLCAAGVLSMTLALAAQKPAPKPPAAQPAPKHEGVHRHPAAARRKNPVPANAESIAAGQKVYETHCAECHGDSGKGDGMMAESLNEKPADFTDDKWEHGTTDGELFMVIRDGTGEEMKGFAKTLSEREIWHVINFIRTLAHHH